MIIAIDGPAGAGKSTVARALAERLGIGYLNTGAMYRALTHLAIEGDVPLDDGEALAALARATPIRLDRERVLAGARDVTGAIREPVVTHGVSQVAAHAQVRRAMVQTQRAILAGGDWVADGRDIGTTVRPDAGVKVFLTADIPERARRRHEELVLAGSDVVLDEVLADIERRDHLDATRAESPLAVADGAIVIDTTGLDVEAVVHRIARIIEGGA